MGLLIETCAVCGRRSPKINCAPLDGGRFLCASCDRTVRKYAKEATGRLFAPSARAFPLDALRAIVAGEEPPLTLPGDDAVEEGFKATGAVGTAVCYNDVSRELLVRPKRDVTGMEVRRSGNVVAYDDIRGVSIFDSGQPLEKAPRTGMAQSIAVQLKLRSGSSQQVFFLRSSQNRKGFAYRQAVEEARFLKEHLGRVIPL